MSEGDGETGKVQPFLRRGASGARDAGAGGERAKAAAGARAKAAPGCGMLARASGVHSNPGAPE